MNVCDIKNIESEAGIIASIVMKPELTFYSEQLKPNHFSDSQNAYIYYAVCELAKRGIEKVDAYNITNILNMKEATKKQTEVITISKDEFRWYLRSENGSSDEFDIDDHIKIASFTLTIKDAKEYLYSFSTRRRVYNWKDINVSVWI